MGRDYSEKEKDDMKAGGAMAGTGAFLLATPLAPVGAAMLLFGSIIGGAAALKHPIPPGGKPRH